VVGQLYVALDMFHDVPEAKMDWTSVLLPCLSENPRKPSWRL